MLWVYLNGNSLTGPKGTVTLPTGALCTLSAVLVLNRGNPVSRDRIDDILWEGDTPDRARDRLNTMLWRLRKLVKKVGGPTDCFLNNREYLSYSPDMSEADSDVFAISDLSKQLLRGETMTDDLATQALDHIALCHTEFLAHAHDYWSIVTRESLRSGLLMIIEALIGYMREQGRWARVTELAERLLIIDPTLELGHQQLIDVHQNRQDAGAVARQSEVLHQVLDKSMNTRKPPETSAAIDALRIAGKNASRMGEAPLSTGRRPVLTRRPTLHAVERALDHIDAARKDLGVPVAGRLPD